MPESNIENKKVFTNKQVMLILSGTISAVFALTSIYSKFIFNDEQLQINKAKIEEVHSELTKEIDELRGALYRKINETAGDLNGRVDRKAERITKTTTDNNEEIEQLQKEVLMLQQEIQYLQKPNSDK